MLLALDTSAAVSVAVCDGRDVLAQRTVHDPRRHAELLIPMVDEVLRSAGVGRGDLTVIAVGRGPGPFTGLRVGLVCARTLGLALGVPVHGVISLDALALQVHDAGAVQPGESFVVATDARRREVYWRRYVVAAHPTANLPVRPSSDPQVCRPADLALEGDPCFGRGAALYPDLLGPAPQSPLDPGAGAVARTAVAELADGGAGGPATTEPLYLRRPDVSEPTVGKSVLGAHRAATQDRRH